MKDQIQQPQRGERWLFTVNRPRAQRVFLVQRSVGNNSSWHEMKATDEPGQFCLEHHLMPGRHRFHYFTSDGRAYINCGTEGLSGTCLSGADPAVDVEPLEFALTA